MLTATRVRELFDYDGVTGNLIRRESSGRRWKAGQVAGCRKPDGYLSIRIDGKLYQHHRVVWLHVHGEWPQADIDHKNRDRSRNAVDNLRDVPRSKNMANAGAHKDSTSGIKGVDWHKQRQKWRARITVDGKEKNLGLYATAQEALAARLSAAKAIHGEGYV